MKNDIIKTRVLQVLAVILAVSAVIIDLQPLISPESNIWLRLTTGCALLSQIYIAIYAICGFRKKAAIFLKIFINLIAFSQFFRIVCMRLLDNVPVMAVMTQLIVFAVLVALTVNEDFQNVKFGRTKSLIFCVIVLAESIGNIYLAMVQVPGVYRGGTVFGSLITIAAFGKFVIALTLWVAIYAKYEDVKKAKVAQIKS